MGARVWEWHRAKMCLVSKVGEGCFIMAVMGATEKVQERQLLPQSYV